MTSKTIRQLIREGESSEVDFKKTITHLDKIAKNITAFANSKGGKILVGVMDNKRIIGINPDEEKYMLTQAAEHFCDPPVALYFTEAEEDEHTVLIAEVKESNKKPHAAKDNHGDWRIYVRSGDQCLLASKMLVDKLRKEFNEEEERKQQLSFSNNEKTLINYLQLRRKITLKEYAKLINVSRRRAANILFGMVKKGCIYEHDHEKNNFYTLA